MGYFQLQTGHFQVQTGYFQVQTRIESGVTEVQSVVGNAGAAACRMTNNLDNENQKNSSQVRKGVV